MAVAGPDRTAAVGELLAFDGAGSTDRDGKLVHYDWDFGDGAHGDGAKVQYAYDRPGTYQVTLTVTDDFGELDQHGRRPGSRRGSTPRRSRRPARTRS